MLKFLLGALLVANLGLFVVQRGQPAGHEPARMNNQLNPERIRLLPASAANPAPAAAASEPVPAPAPAPAEPVAGAAPSACIELLSFSAAEAVRFEARMDALGLTGRLSRRDMPSPANYMVMLPPQGSREAADLKTTELRGLGVTDSFIIQDNSSRRFGIALGTFRSQEAAQAHLEAMGRRGVRTARIAEVGTGPARLAIQLRALDPAAEAQVMRARAEFPRLESRNCG